jgi:hypothetical protein
MEMRRCGQPGAGSDLLCRLKVAAPSFRIFERNCKKNEEQEKIWVLVRLVLEQLQWSPEKVAAGLHWAPPATMKALECKLNESAGHDGFIPTQY